MTKQVKMKAEKMHDIFSKLSYMPTQDEVTSVLDAVISMPDIKNVEDAYADAVNRASSLVHSMNAEQKALLATFIDEPSRIATYDVSVWKPLKALTDFIASDKTEVDATMLEIISKIVADSKFVNIPAVLNVALPMQNVVEPMIQSGNRWKGIAAAIATVLTLKDNEQTSGVQTTEENWKNEKTLALRRMGFNV